MKIIRPNRSLNIEVNEDGSGRFNHFVIQEQAE